ncbi:hypothetical protein [Paraburkholderia sediminicola]|uniref:hypothetical protein n=1 Tax=Paraburkholderia sediminicola TaxID=458836 RepID=UPI0038B8006B
MGWLDIAEWVAKNWATVIATPAPFIGALGLGAAGGYWLANKLAAGQLAQKDERITHHKEEVAAASARTEIANETIADLRRRLGLDPATQHKYAAMTGAELQQCATNLAAQIEQLAADYKRSTQVRATFPDPGMSKEQAAEEWQRQGDILHRELAETMATYNRACRADAMVIFDEMINRGSRAPRNNHRVVDAALIQSPTNPIGLQNVSAALSTMALRIPT